jgi:hypothetical protein
VKCTLNQTTLRPGITVQLTYEIDTNQPTPAGLGAGLYDNQGKDRSTGYGDINSLSLPAGRSTKSRSVKIPANLAPGKYELDAEVWPANEVGANGANTLADGTCEHFRVP